MELPEEVAVESKKEVTVLQLSEAETRVLTEITRNDSPNTQVGYNWDNAVQRKPEEYTAL